MNKLITRTARSKFDHICEINHNPIFVIHFGFYVLCILIMRQYQPESRI